MQQQDSSEFLLHLFDTITRASPAQNPVDAFKSVLETRLQCMNCRKVRYKTDEQENITVSVPTRRITKDQSITDPEVVQKDEYEPVSLEECLDVFTEAESIDGLKCGGCGNQSNGGFTKQQKFRTFPQVLAITCHRFGRVNGVLTKLDVPVVVSDDQIPFDKYFSTGHQPGEDLLPEDDDAPSFVPNAAALQQLEEVGFPRVRCEKALHATGNSDANEAMNWLMGHMDDPDIDTPLNLGGSKKKTEVSAESLEMIGAMGFSAPQGRQALKENGGNVEAAIGWLLEHPDAIGDFGDDEVAPQGGSAKEKVLAGSAELPAIFQLQSIICHKGTSMHAGHYVAFIRKNAPGDSTSSWVLFNDEKVAKAVDVDEMKKFAYIYFFRRL